MPDLAQSIDRIRDFMASADLLVPDEVREAGVHLERACRSANDRLSQCDALLRQGLRVEAVSLATQEPHLIDYATALNFAEFARWTQVCGTEMISAPPPVRVAQLKELNRAFVDVRPMLPLLAEHRKLALQNAPLADRLAALHKIAALDPSNPVWQKDIELWERERLKSLDRDLKAAVKARDDCEIQRLYEEIAIQPWNTPLPEATAERARMGKAESDDRLTIVAVRKALEQLETAVGGYDVEAAERTVAQFTAQADSRVVRTQGDLSRRWSDAKAWVDRQMNMRREEGRFRKLVNEAEILIADRAESAEVEKKLASIRQLDIDVPPEIQDRAKRLKAEQVLSRKRRRLLSTSATVAVVVMAVVGVGWYVSHSAAKNRADAARAILFGFAEAEQLAEARAFIDQTQKNDPDTFANAEVQAQVARIGKLESEEVNRVTRHAKLLEEYRALASSNTTESEMLFTLQRLSRSDDDRAAVERARSARAEVTSARRKRQEQDEILELDLLVDRVEDCKRLMDSEGAISAERRLDGLERDLSAWKAAHEDATPAAMGRLSDAIRRLGTVKSRVAESRGEQTAVRTAAISFAAAERGLADVASTLDGFKREMPQSGQARDLVYGFGRGRAAAEYVLAWNDLRQSAPSLSSQQLAAKASALVAGAPSKGDPTLKAIAAFAEYHKAKEARGKLFSGLRELCQRPDCRNVYQILTADMTYFTDRSYEPELTREVFKVVPGRIQVHPIKSSSRELQEGEMTIKPELVLETPRLSPHCSLFARLDDQLRLAAPGAEVEAGAEFLRQLVGANECDGFIRLRVYRAAAPFLKSCSPALAEACAKLDASFADAAIDETVEWIAAEPRSQAQRVKSLKAMKAAGDLVKWSEILEDATKRDARLRADFEVAPRTPFGIAIKPGRTPSIVAGVSPSQPKELFALIPGLTARWLPVGRWDGKDLTYLAARVELEPGTLIFCE